MFYSTITDSTVVSSDLISQPISFSNVNTKGEAEPLAASSTHLLLLMHNWLPWKEARKGKQQAIILTPVSPNWNPLTISTDDRSRGDVGLFIPRALFPACCSLCIETREDVGLHYNQELCLIPVLIGGGNTAAKHLQLRASGWDFVFFQIKIHSGFCTPYSVNQVDLKWKNIGLSVLSWMPSMK